MSDFEKFLLYVLVAEWLLRLLTEPPSYVVKARKKMNSFLSHPSKKKAHGHKP